MCIADLCSSNKPGHTTSGRLRGKSGATLASCVPTTYFSKYDALPIVEN